jgi:hypothetical protein
MQKSCIYIYSIEVIDSVIGSGTYSCRISVQPTEASSHHRVPLFVSTEQDGLSEILY